MTQEQIQAFNRICEDPTSGIIGGKTILQEDKLNGKIVRSYYIGRIYTNSNAIDTSFCDTEEEAFAKMLEKAQQIILSNK